MSCFRVKSPYGPQIICPQQSGWVGNLPPNILPSTYQCTAPYLQTQIQRTNCSFNTVPCQLTRLPPRR